VNILRFFDMKRRVISNYFLEFIPMGLFEIECWGSCVGVANGSELESNIDREVVWRGAGARGVVEKRVRVGVVEGV